MEDHWERTLIPCGRHERVCCLLVLNSVTSIPHAPLASNLYTVSNGKALSRRCVVNTLVPLFCCSTYYKAVRVGGGDSGGIPSTIKKKNSSVKRDLVYCQKRPKVYPLHYLHYPLHEACAIELTNVDVSKVSCITST
jgi:hypothetical protein